MRYVLTLTLTLLVIGSAKGAPDATSNRINSSPRQIGARGAYDAREGGEDIATAFVISGDVALLPFHGTGNTCDNVNDYDEACHSAASTSPDVVYSFTPSEDLQVDVNLCASTYGTRVYVYDISQTVYACNDYACDGWQSFIYGLALTGGVTYYIVIDGQSGYCGAYDLILERRNDCVGECPAGAMVEGELPCGDGYEDLFNGGCWSSNLAWSQLEAGPDGCATVCGKICTYVYGGVSHRDSDWYEGIAAGGLVTVSCMAEFPSVVALDPYDSCNMAPEGSLVLAAPCALAQTWIHCAPGQVVWVFVSPIGFFGVPESDYVFTVCGLAAEPTPVEETSWGRIKSRYR